MKLAVVSDIHGNLPALEAVTGDIQKRGVDLVINLGDHLSGPLWPEETAQFLMKRDWAHLAGNHDKNLVTLTPDKMGASDKFTSKLLSDETITWLKSLDESFEAEELLAFHGIPTDSGIYLLEEIWDGRSRLATKSEIQKKMGNVKADLICCGHTHIPRIISYENSTIVNPGSVGLQAYDDTLPEYHIMETGSTKACYAIIDEGKEISVDLIYISYDHESAAKKAEENGRPDWATGLRTGYLSK